MKMFVNEYAKHGNGTQAVLSSYDTSNPKSAKVIASKLLDIPKVAAAVEVRRKTLKQALIEQDMTEDEIARRVKMLLDAKDVEGNPDYSAIDKGIKHAITIYGVIDPSERPAGTANIYNFIFSEEGRAKVSEVEAEIKAGLIRKKPIRDVQEA